jgi:HD-GYP domain-containing protein (c-di-GMP phosphodiesterase class II)
MTSLNGSRWISRFTSRSPATPAKRSATTETTEQRLSDILEQGRCCHTPDAVQEAIQQALRAAVRFTGAPVGYVMMIDRVERMLVSETVVSIGGQASIPSALPLGDGLEGQVAEMGIALMASKRAKNSPSSRTPEQYGYPRDIEAALCVPLIQSPTPEQKMEVLGVVTLLHDAKGRTFTDMEADIVQIIVGTMATALACVRFYTQKKDKTMRTLQEIMTLLDSRDVSSRGHSHRVAEVCVLIARRMKLDEATIHTLKTGALLHDIGKIVIPEDILRKPERLTESEFAILRQYPLIGYEIAKSLDFDEEILLLLRNHTEKLDGSGYPDNLHAGEIPLPLRILCVADAFDAMSSYRSYRPTLDSQARREQLNRFAGTQFDPNVVEVLKELLSSGELDPLYRSQWYPMEEQTAWGRPLDQAA